MPAVPVAAPAPYQMPAEPRAGASYVPPAMPGVQAYPAYGGSASYVPPTPTMPTQPQAIAAPQMFNMAPTAMPPAAMSPTMIPGMQPAYTGYPGAIPATNYTQ